MATGVLGRDEAGGQVQGCGSGGEMRLIWALGIVLRMGAFLRDGDQGAARSLGYWAEGLKLCGSRCRAAMTGPWAGEGLVNNPLSGHAQQKGFHFCRAQNDPGDSWWAREQHSTETDAAPTHTELRAEDRQMQAEQHPAGMNISGLKCARGRRGMRDSGGLPRVVTSE